MPVKHVLTYFWFRKHCRAQAKRNLQTKNITDKKYQVVAKSEERARVSKPNSYKQRLSTAKQKGM